MGITPRTALGFVATLALANAPATLFVSTLTDHMPEAVAAGLSGMAPAQPAMAQEHPVARPDKDARVAEASGADVPQGGGAVACLAEAVYFEARGTGAEGEQAVAHVVVNRAKADAFPDSVCGVVQDGCQFSYRCDGRSDALSDTKARARAYRVAETVLSGAPDITKGALFFHSARASTSFREREKLGVFGGNVFYR